jgi:nucleotide-binding universal stress UspA family protein
MEGIRMIKTILVPTSGSSTDDGVFATALALARPLAAHLGFYHVRLTPVEAAVRAPHVAYCVGAALTSALEFLHDKEDLLAATAATHFNTFCKDNELSIRSAPGNADLASASWCEEVDDPARRLMMHARHSDLVVVGRPHQVDYMPNLLIEDLLINSGRPIVIAPETAPAGVTDTIVVGWKEAPEAARALAAAMPLLECAKRVVLLSISEGEDTMAQAHKHLAWQLAWHGISAESRIIEGKANQVPALLTQAAADLHAGLLVVGAFGRGPLREAVFGGVTRSLIEDAKIPIFMLH